MALDDLRTAAAAHRAAVERWETDRAVLILAAREDGATWPAVAEAAGMSQAQVRTIAQLAEARRTHVERPDGECVVCHRATDDGRDRCYRHPASPG